ncbi:MAG: carboxypeptidase-like regulatory domain-containing protein [Bacteroidetes bacterium]|nr:carboxypeptidase-like regulatory domain-containing protein [Bacteroidota bacterium]
MTKKFFFLPFLFFATTSYAQVISGKIVDSLKREPVAFANIVLADGIHGTTSDIEGNFKLSVPAGYQQAITISHVSYQKTKLPLSFFNKYRVIKLKPSEMVLSEVVVKAGENPAFRIIRNAVKNKSRNNPDNLESYQYHSYNKFIIKPSEMSDPYKKRVDSLRNGSIAATKKQKELLQWDSISSRIHFFMTESVTEKKVINPGRQKETLIGFKASGFKSPLFANVATDYQPFSFYNDKISLLGKDFLNPISKNSEQRYEFYLTDTTYIENDTVYVIQYEPKRGKLITGLKGMVSISTNGWAIKNIIASSSDSLALTGIRIQQNYEQVNGQWFPAQLNTDIDFYNLKQFGSYIIAQHRSFIKDVKFNPALNKSEFGDIKVDLSPPAGVLNEANIEKFRIAPLDTKEAKTYVTIDSAMQKFQWLDKTMEALATNALPIGPFDFDLTRLVHINQYEGFRLGGGLYTSNRFLTWLRVGGYGAYGFKDQQWKYGAEVRFNLNPNRDFGVTFQYINDIYETGYAHQNVQRDFTNANEGLRRLVSERFDKIESYRVDVSYRVLPRVHASAFVSKNNITPTYDYTLTLNGETLNRFAIGETGLALRYSGSENYMQISGKKVLLGREWPMVSIGYARSIQVWDAQNFDYQRLDFSSRFQFKHRPKGKTRLFVHAGWVDGVAPYGRLYNARGAQETQAIYVDEYFQTVGLYEFAASRYASVFFNHNFGNVFYDNRYSKPEWVVYHASGIGWLDNANAHASSQISLQSFDKGFFESGTGFNNLLRFKYANVAYFGLGAAVFYRYGAYQFEKQTNNLFFRATFSLGF